MKFTKDKFLSFYKGEPVEAAAGECYDKLVEHLTDKNILTDYTLIGALATVRVEVGRKFKPIEEYASGEAYEGRKDLGNYRPGDGKLYKGRGYIQITGYNNYKNYGKAIGVDLVCNPELALTSDNSAKILAQYFLDHNLRSLCEAKDWVGVRRAVNGGTNGLQDFLSYVNQYLAKM